MSVMDPGQLRHRMIIEQPADEPDGAGGAVRQFVVMKTVWAHIQPLKASDRVTDMAMEQVLTHRITLRSGTELTTQHRLRLGSRVFCVRSLTPHMDQNGLLHVLAEEIKP